MAADAAAAGPGKTVAVVGDGAVGRPGVLAAKQMGAERIVLMSRHEARQRLGGPAPVRRYLPDLIDLIWKGAMDPGQVFDLTLPLEQVHEGYRAMAERRAIKSLLTP